MKDVHFHLSNMYLVRDYCTDAENALKESVYDTQDLLNKLDQECASFREHGAAVESKLRDQMQSVQNQVQTLRAKAADAQAKQQMPVPEPAQPSVPSGASAEQKQAALAAYRQELAQVQQKNAQIQQENQRIQSYVAQCQNAISRLETILSRLTSLEASARSSREATLSAAQENHRRAAEAAGQGRQILAAAGAFYDAFSRVLDAAQKIQELEAPPVSYVSYIGRELTIRNTHAHPKAAPVSFSFSADFRSNTAASAAERPEETGEVMLVQEKSAQAFRAATQGVSRIKTPSANLHRLGGKAFLEEMESRGFCLVKHRNGALIDDHGFMYWEKKDE